MKKIVAFLTILGVATAFLFLSCQVEADAGQTGVSLGSVDTDGDGVADGTAIDTNGDGVADGVDTDGDGTIDTTWSDDYTIITDTEDNDTTAPAEITNLKLTKVGYCTDESSSHAYETLMTFTWDDPSDSDFKSVVIGYDGKEATVTKGEETVTISNFSNENTLYTITLKTVDTSGNKSEGTNMDVFATSNSMVSPVYITEDNAEYLHTVLKENKAGYIILETDIDLDNCDWAPIGSGEDLFSGVFDGNGHTLSNFNSLDYEIKASEVGFFTSFLTSSSPMIMNLTMSDCDITISGTHSRMGILAANLNEDGHIYNCKVSGSLTSSGTDALGGLVGLNNGIIENSVSKVSVKTSGGFVGSFVGHCWGIIKKSYATGNVTYSEESSTSSKWFGGFAGDVQSGQISNCYATGKVKGDTVVGGFVGLVKSSTLTNCYSAGAVSGYSPIAGFCSSESGNISVSNCYFNSKAANEGDSYATDITLTNKANFSGFDFDSVWSIDSSVNGGMPYLTELKPE